MHFAYFSSQDESLYNAAQNIEYLDMVWQESLRMYAPGGLWVFIIKVTLTHTFCKLIMYNKQARYTQLTACRKFVWTSGLWTMELGVK